MDFFKSFEKRLFQLDEYLFETEALELFRYQASNNEIYSEYISHLGIKPEKITQIADIPFLPISFFKSQKVVTNHWNEERIFESSGTTGELTSKHYVKDTSFYLKNCLKIFQEFYGQPEDFHILALLPSYLERDNSSLICMVQDLIVRTKSSHSGFYLANHNELYDTLKVLIKDDKRKVMLIGVSFGLLDFIDQYQLEAGQQLVVMETGGMKGRRRELIRNELHQILKEGFGIEGIHSEYGMTELMSQAYATKDGKFKCPPWMKVMIRDINDPFDVGRQTGRGGINIIDLANVHSCAFIETHDIGNMMPDGSFEVLGRFDNSDIRGCNLLIS